MSILLHCCRPVFILCSLYISLYKVLCYWLAQMLGAFASSVILYGVYIGEWQLQVTSQWRMQGRDPGVQRNHLSKFMSKCGSIFLFYSNTSIIILKYLLAVKIMFTIECWPEQHSRRHAHHFSFLHRVMAIRRWAWSKISRRVRSATASYI